MKKLIIIPLMFVYLLAVSGVMIYAHYCGTELSSWNVYAQNDGCADEGCGDEAGAPDDCCKDKVVAAKVTNDQDVAHPFVLKALFAEITSIYFPPAYNSDAEPIALRDISNYPNAPPGLWQQIPLFKLHSSFTYYG